jgi:hypothetical protein
MIIGNFKSTQDKDAKQNLQKSLLELEISNEAEKEKRQKDFKNPYKAVAVPPQFKSNSEIQKDRIEQEKQAIANMTELGFDYNKGAELTAWLSSSMINKLVAFNANFKGIKKELSETTNPKLLNLDYLKNYLEKYFEDIDINYGRKFGKTDISGTPQTATLDELEMILPSIAELQELEDGVKAFNRILAEAEEAYETRLINLDKADEDITLDIVPFADELDEYSRAELTDKKTKRNKIIQSETKKVEDALSKAEELRRKGYQLIALIHLLIAVLPSQELLNLIKTNLSQNDRSDLIRRYTIIIKKLKLLSNQELNELNTIIQKYNPSLEEIDKIYRRLASSLAFLTNEADVNSLTKLQRDYEVYISQSGKPINLDSLKRYADVQDAEIRKAREEFQQEGFYRGEVKKRPIELINRELEGRQQLTKQRMMSEIDAQKEREAGIAKEMLTVEGTLMAKNLALGRIAGAPLEGSEAIRYGDEERVKSMAKLDARNYLKYLGTITEAEQIISLRNVIRANFGIKGIKKQAGESDEDFLIGLKQIYTDRMADKIAVLQPQPAQALTEGDKVVRMRADLSSPSAQLIQAISALGQTEQRDAIRAILTNPPFSTLPNAEPRILPNSKIFKKKQSMSGADFTQGLRDLLRQRLDEFYATIPNEKVPLYAHHPVEIAGQQYGWGMKDRLRKHFKEDKEYLTKQAKQVKDINKIISSHIMETEPIEHKIKTALGGEGLAFKHTRIKVGRGITATEQPQYKTFGKYVIHYGHLIDRNIANFKYPSLGSIPAIKPVNITDDYKDFLIDTLNTGKANERALSKLPTEEKKHFERVVLGAGLLETFNLKRGYDGDEKKDADRFVLLRGEVMAGNNNDKLLKELRLLIIKLMANGRIQRNEGTNMLIELSTI